MYKHKYMIGTRYGGGRAQTLRYSCPIGMTEEDLAKLFPTEDEMAKFNHWLVGQTRALCLGRRYNFDTEEYEPDDCAGNPHGPIVYPEDVQRYLS